MFKTERGLNLYYISTLGKRARWLELLIGRRMVEDMRGTEVWPARADEAEVGANPVSRR